MSKLYKRSRQARHWIKYTIIPSFIPIVLIVGFDTILGYTIKNIINRHLVDFILIVFAIAVSVYGSAKTLNKMATSDDEKEKSDNFVLWSEGIGIWCTALFSFLYDKLKPEDSITFKKIIFCIVQIIITYFIIYKGMQTEEKLEASSQLNSSTTNNTQP